MSKKNNFGRAIYDIFGVGKDESEDEELSGELEAPEVVSAREAPADPFAQASAPPPFSPPSPPRQTPFSESPFSERPFSDPMQDFRVERAIPVHNYEGTYLASGTMLRGILTARGDVEIAGEFEGEIIAKGKVTIHSDITSKVTAMGLSLVGSNLTGDVDVSGDVTINDQSSITGNVRAENLSCSGRIKGDLDIQDNLVLEGSAEIDGSISADTMAVARGAKITGSVEMRNVRGK